MQPEDRKAYDELLIAFACVFLLAVARYGYCLSIPAELRDRLPFIGETVFALLAAVAFALCPRVVRRGNPRLAMLLAIPTLSLLSSVAAMRTQFFIF